MPMRSGTSSSAFWALCDQASVSAANFLAIALGAWMLELGEQSKLVYGYTFYFALVLFNASALFSAAPVLRYEVSDAAAYKRLLLRAQCLIAVAGAVIALVVFMWLGAALDWVPDAIEMGCILLFLGLQQLADFNRRADYVFGEIKGAALISVLGLALRLGLLLPLQPQDAATFYLIFAISAIPGAYLAIRRGWGVPGSGDDAHVLRRHMRLARWNMLHAPLQWMGLHSPVFLVGALAGGGAAAILASVRSVGTVANVLLELMETYVPNWMASRARQQGPAGMRSVVLKLYALGGVLWLAAAIAIVTIGESILALLLGRGYAEYWPILLLLWVGNGLYFLGRVYGVKHRVSRWTSVELAGSAGGLAVLLVSLPLMSLYGALGGACAIVLVQLGSMLTQLAYARRFVRQ